MTGLGASVGHDALSFVLLKCNMFRYMDGGKHFYVIGCKKVFPYSMRETYLSVYVCGVVFLLTDWTCMVGCIRMDV